MTISLDIRPEFEAELAAMAGAQGLSAKQYAMQVLEKALESAAVRKPSPSDRHFPEVLQFDTRFSQGTVYTTEEVLIEVWLFSPGTPG